MNYRQNVTIYNSIKHRSWQLLSKKIYLIPIMQIQWPKLSSHKHTTGSHTVTVHPVYLLAQYLKLVSMNFSLHKLRSWSKLSSYIFFRVSLVLIYNIPVIGTYSEITLTGFWEEYETPHSVILSNLLLFPPSSV